MVEMPCATLLGKQIKDPLTTSISRLRPKPPLIVLFSSTAVDSLVGRRSSTSSQTASSFSCVWGSDGLRKVAVISFQFLPLVSASREFTYGTERRPPSPLFLSTNVTQMLVPRAVSRDMLHFTTCRRPPRPDEQR